MPGAVQVRALVLSHPEKPNSTPDSADVSPGAALLVSPTADLATVPAATDSADGPRRQTTMTEMLSDPLSDHVWLAGSELAILLATMIPLYVGLAYWFEAHPDGGESVRKFEEWKANPMSRSPS